MIFRTDFDTYSAFDRNQGKRDLSFPRETLQAFILQIKAEPNLCWIIFSQSVAGVKEAENVSEVQWP